MDKIGGCLDKIRAVLDDMDRDYDSAIESEDAEDRETYFAVIGDQIEDLENAVKELKDAIA